MTLTRISAYERLRPGEVNHNAKISLRGPLNVRKLEGGQTRFRWAAVQGHEGIL